MRERTGIVDLRAHDLRRTVATRVRALGFPRETVDALLGHREARLAQTYQVYDHLKEKTAALRAWERELGRILASEEATGPDVIAFPKRVTGSSRAH